VVEALAGATRLHAVPALLRQIVRHLRMAERARPYDSLLTIFVGGDVVTADLLVEVAEAFPQAQVEILYGPTEGTVICSSHAVAPGAWRPLLGRPLGNMAIHLRDAQGGPVPIGVAGEVCLDGIGVSRGYLGRPDVTAERYVPFPGGRLYRTGDLARALPDGTLEFLGRIDHQVKIRGFRIELGEVEAVLRRQSAVREAIVVVREEPSRDRRLVAYLVGPEERELPRIREALRAVLPEHMVPADLVVLPTLPLTPNGKLDRSALPAPERAPQASYAAPRGALEQSLAAIWHELLGIPRVSRSDNFFDLGGHSLLMVQLRTQLQERLGRDVPILDLFRFPTVSALARLLNDGGADDSTVRLDEVGKERRAGRQRLLERRKRQRGS
jgi:acyl-CoA synthetase (AMP-forming)/AMP-acid ligase II/acyl carrier protein